MTCRVYKEAEELHKDYESGVVHPSDLKPALSAALNTILQPVRDHFENDPRCKGALEEGQVLQGNKVSAFCIWVQDGCSREF